LQNGRSVVARILAVKTRIRKSNVKRRKFGFLARMKTRSGRRIIQRQRKKGKWKLAK